MHDDACPAIDILSWADRHPQLRAAIQDVLAAGRIEVRRVGSGTVHPDIGHTVVDPRLD